MSSDLSSLNFNRGYLARVILEQLADDVSEDEVLGAQDPVSSGAAIVGDLESALAGETRLRSSTNLTRPEPVPQQNLVINEKEARDFQDLIQKRIKDKLVNQSEPVNYGERYELKHDCERLTFDPKEESVEDFVQKINKLSEKKILIEAQSETDLQEIYRSLESQSKRIVFDINQINNSLQDNDITLVKSEFVPIKSLMVSGSSGSGAQSSALALQALEQFKKSQAVLILAHNPVMQREITKRILEFAKKQGIDNEVASSLENLIGARSLATLNPDARIYISNPGTLKAALRHNIDNPDEEDIPSLANSLPLKRLKTILVDDVHSYSGYKFTERSEENNKVSNAHVLDHLLRETSTESKPTELIAFSSTPTDARSNTGANVLYLENLFPGIGAEEESGHEIRTETFDEHIALHNLKSPELVLMDGSIRDGNINQAQASLKEALKSNSPDSMAKNIVQWYQEHTQQGKFLVQAMDATAAKRLTEAFNQAGVNAVMMVEGRNGYTGKLVNLDDPNDTRNEAMDDEFAILRSFEDKESSDIQILVHVGEKLKGYTNPNIEGLIFADASTHVPKLARVLGATSAKNGTDSDVQKPKMLLVDALTATSVKNLIEEQRGIVRYKTPRQADSVSGPADDTSTGIALDDVVYYRGDLVNNHKLWFEKYLQANIDLIYELEDTAEDYRTRFQSSLDSFLADFIEKKSITKNTDQVKNIALGLTVDHDIFRDFIDYINDRNEGLLDKNQVISDVPELTGIKDKEEAKLQVKQVLANIDREQANSKWLAKWDEVIAKYDDLVDEDIQVHCITDFLESYAGLESFANKESLEHHVKTILGISHDPVIFQALAFNLGLDFDEMQTEFPDLMGEAENIDLNLARKILQKSFPDGPPSDMHLEDFFFGEIQKEPTKMNFISLYRACQNDQDPSTKEVLSKEQMSNRVRAFIETEIENQIIGQNYGYTSYDPDTKSFHDSDIARELLDAKTLEEEVPKIVEEFTNMELEEIPNLSNEILLLQMREKLWPQAAIRTKHREGLGFSYKLTADGFDIEPKNILVALHPIDLIEVAPEIRVTDEETGRTLHPSKARLKTQLGFIGKNGRSLSSFMENSPEALDLVHEAIPDLAGKSLEETVADDRARLFIVNSVLKGFNVKRSYGENQYTMVNKGMQKHHQAFARKYLESLNINLEDEYRDHYYTIGVWNKKEAGLASEYAFDQMFPSEGVLGLNQADDINESFRKSYFYFGLDKKGFENYADIPKLDERLCGAEIHLARRLGEVDELSNSTVLANLGSYGLASKILSGGVSDADKRKDVLQQIFSFLELDTSSKRKKYFVSNRLRFAPQDEPGEHYEALYSKRALVIKFNDKEIMRLQYHAKGNYWTDEDGEKIFNEPVTQVYNEFLESNDISHCNKEWMDLFDGELSSQNQYMLIAGFFADNPDYRKDPTTIHKTLRTIFGDKRLFNRNKFGDLTKEQETFRKFVSYMHEHGPVLSRKLRLRKLIPEFSKLTGVKDFNELKLYAQANHSLDDLPNPDDLRQQMRESASRSDSSKFSQIQDKFVNIYKDLKRELGFSDDDALTKLGLNTVVDKYKEIFSELENDFSEPIPLRDEPKEVLLAFNLIKEIYGKDYPFAHSGFDIVDGKVVSFVSISNEGAGFKKLAEFDNQDGKDKIKNLNRVVTYDLDLNPNEKSLEPSLISSAMDRARFINHEIDSDLSTDLQLICAGYGKLFTETEFYELLVGFMKETGSNDVFEDPYSPESLMILNNFVTMLLGNNNFHKKLDAEGMKIAKDLQNAFVEYAQIRGYDKITKDLFIKARKDYISEALRKIDVSPKRDDTLSHSVARSNGSAYKTLEGFLQEMNQELGISLDIDDLFYDLEVPDDEVCIKRVEAGFAEFAKDEAELLSQDGYDSSYPAGRRMEELMKESLSSDDLRLSEYKANTALERVCNNRFADIATMKQYVRVKVNPEHGNKVLTAHLNADNIIFEVGIGDKPGAFVVAYGYNQDSQSWERRQIAP